MLCLIMVCYLCVQQQSAINSESIGMSARACRRRITQRHAGFDKLNLTAIQTNTTVNNTEFRI